MTGLQGMMSDVVRGMNTLHFLALLLAVLAAIAFFRLIRG